VGVLALSLGCYSGLGSPAAGDGEMSGSDDGPREDSGESGDDGASACGETPMVAYTPMRRLSRREYEHSMLDLVGIAVDTTSFPPDESSSGFASNSSAPVAALTVEGYMNAAAGVAAQIDPLAILPCDPEALGHEPCARMFVETFGRRTYRRPLADDERDAITSLLLGKASATDFGAGVRLAVELMLQSPHFLYRPELAPAAGEPATPLSDFEVATRLSYLVWASGPDDALLDAAAAGELATTDGLVAQAERMLDDAKASRGIASFHEQWLGLTTLATLHKDTGAFPEFDPELRAAMYAETLAFVEDVVRDGDGSFASLFTAQSSWINEPLAAIYGIEGIVGPELRRVELPAAERGGILTQPSMLAVLSDSVRSLPPRAGKHVQAHILCNAIAEPPADVDTTPPEVAPGTSTREAWEMKTSPAQCGACHEHINPIGFAFLNYDPIGRWRDEDGGGSIDASGTLADVGTFANAVELGARIGESDKARACYVKHWLRYGLGRYEHERETCSTETVEHAFADADGDIDTLVRALITSPAFRHAGAPSQ
jgi:hypothetical protein